MSQHSARTHVILARLPMTVSGLSLRAKILKISRSRPFLTLQSRSYLSIDGDAVLAMDEYSWGWVKSSMELDDIF